MKINEKVKAFLNQKKGIAMDASDSEFVAALANSFIDGTMSQNEYVAMSKDPDADRASAFEQKLDKLFGRMDDIEKRVTPSQDHSSDSAVLKSVRTGIAGAEAQRDDVRVKGVQELYDTKRHEMRFPERTSKGARHPMAGQPVREGDRNLKGQSDLDKAICGAYLKWCLNSQNGGKNNGLPRALQMTEHDEQLVKYALHESEWAGVLHGDGTEREGSIGIPKGRKLSDFERKALIDDATSGGIEIAPIMFDEAVVQTPLLYGEFYPRVNTVTVTRGRRIEGGAMGNVTLSSGGVDGSAIPLFNTASFVTAFDTTIFACNGAIEIGLDFLSDSPIDVASVVTEQYGRVLMAWLDEQVCTGDGTTEPEGVLNASGTTTVTATGGAAGPPTVGDYESLLFGVAKKYKQGFPTDRIAYAGTETSYQRARAIAVSATDQRRVFGMTHEDYLLFGHPYGISEHLTNRQTMFVNWARYRMYRRAGLTIRTSMEGETLIRSNLMLITARARYGGQLEDGGAAAVCTNGQT